MHHFPLCFTQETSCQILEQMSHFTNVTAVETIKHSKRTIRLSVKDKKHEFMRNAAFIFLSLFSPLLKKASDHKTTDEEHHHFTAYKCSFHVFVVFKNGSFIITFYMFVYTLSVCWFGLTGQLTPA